MLGGQLHALRPDRMKVVPGPDGWPEAWEYEVAGRSVRYEGEIADGIRPILHLKLFHPGNDHYGLSPIEAAATAIDISWLACLRQDNEAARWNVDAQHRFAMTRCWTTPPGPRASWSQSPDHVPTHRR